MGMSQPMPASGGDEKWRNALRFSALQLADLARRIRAVVGDGPNRLENSKP
jgi:hypothetical protein